MKYTIIIEPVSKRIEVNEGTTVYHALAALNHPIGALCGGKGTCGKCKISSISAGKALSNLNSVEKALLSQKEQQQGVRLACQCTIHGDCRIVLLAGLISAGNKILVESDLEHIRGEKKVKLQPNLYYLHLNVPLPHIHNARDDFSRFMTAFHTRLPSRFFQLHTIDDDFFTLSKTLPYKLRAEEGNVTVTYWKDAEKLYILDVESGHREDLYGIAIDLGTTTIVGYLMNLKSGDIMSVSSMLNPQVSIGEDIVTRITYIKQNNAAEKSQELIISAFNQILDESCKKAKISPLQVKELVVVGNTGMHHMLYGLETEQLAKTPFVPVFKAPIYIKTAPLGITASPNARIYSPPVIAGFVGTDTIGCIVSSRIDTYDEFSLLIDVGTNGELVMGNKNGLICGSCAAGSALEGAHIAYGMRAAEGAIEKLRIDPITFKANINTIGNTLPIGYCGSGLIDLIAEMIRTKMIKRNGNFNVDLISKGVLEYSTGSPQYIIYNAEVDGEPFNDDRKDFRITISQTDIRQLQLAKGAFLSGAYLLQKNFSPSSKLEQILLAGAFGNYIDKESARIIGLFPEINPKNIYQIGNAAGLGAQMCLKDQEMRKFANKIAHEVKYFEIASAKEFQKVFANSMYFPSYNLDQFPSLEEIYHDIPLR